MPLLIVWLIIVDSGILMMLATDFKTLTGTTSKLLSFFFRERDKNIIDFI